MAAGRIGSALLGFALIAAGCAHHPLKVREPNPIGEYHQVHSNAFFWGAVEQTKYADQCATNVLDEVQTVTSLPQALATVLTLGIWMPATVKYKCAKRPVLPDDPEPGE